MRIFVQSDDMKKSIEIVRPNEFDFTISGSRQALLNEIRDAVFEIKRIESEKAVDK